MKNFFYWITDEIGNLATMFMLATCAGAAAFVPFALAWGMFVGLIVGGFVALALFVYFVFDLYRIK